MSTSYTKRKMNAGEWCEPYAFIKILAEGRLYSANNLLVLNKNDWVDVLHVIKESEIQKTSLHYKIDPAQKAVLICNKDTPNTPISIIQSKDLADTANVMLQEILSGHSGKGAFQIGSSINFLEQQLLSPKLKAKNKEKSDLIAQVHYPKLSKIIDAGFSIKSFMAADPTPFNASQSTSLRFDIDGFNKLDAQTIIRLNKIGSKRKVTERVIELQKLGCKLVNPRADCDQFQENLETVDSLMPQIYGDLLIKHFSSLDKSMLSDLIERQKNENICNLRYDGNSNPYREKVESLLAAMWRGMTANKKWDGATEINGGFLFVKENGEIACFHIFNWSHFKDYLYEHARLDSPSTSRHKYGEINSDGTILLNASVRHKFERDKN